MAPNDRLDQDAALLLDPGTEARADSSDTKGPWAVAEATVGADGLQPALQGTGFTYRHPWGARRGEWLLRLNWNQIQPGSQVFVAIGEGLPDGPDAGKFIGGARYTLHNVAPREGGVDIWVNIEWSADISLYADYLIVNPPVAPPDPRTVSVTVHRHGSVALSDAEADRILADMGTILQNDDTGPDVATPVRFVRNGAVRVLPATVPGTIQTSADLNALLSAGSGIKIVQAIRWCGGPGDSIIGCAPVGSTSINLAAVRFTADQEGLIWVHEYGHNCGLGHRSDDPRAVMYPSVGVDHNVVNEAESAAFLSGPASVTGKVMPAGGCSCGTGGLQAPADVRDFVSRHWVEGVPWELASRYTEKDARLLLDWLVNEPEKHEEFLTQVVATLGHIGSEVAVQPLIDFVQGPRAGRAVFNARNTALLRLGDLANQTGSRAALDFLTRVAGDMDLARALAAPQATEEKAIAAKAGPDVVAPTLDTLAAELAVSATFGLALAGTAQTQQAVEALMANPDAFATVNQAAREAAQIAATVRAKGREEYYRMKAEHRHRL
ncbi:hypothetical protein [Massilia sp. BSC265]|uniref:hypothetical protein n=1 Tax=Massilia sp. BSC265 TaxID=1549812 RepID=UPI0004E872B9|nr:hypothetical protein [Massilia sp. BSC265]KFI08351.1 hypothetical protein JN27_04075 [Massilia sp. BSC265]